MNHEKHAAGITESQNFLPSVLQGLVSVQAHVDPLAITVEMLELKISDDQDGLVVASDVVANSLNYHFTHRKPDELFTALNVLAAFASHSLYKCLDSFWNWSGYNFPDTFYHHPSDPGLKR